LNDLLSFANVTNLNVTFGSITSSNTQTFEPNGVSGIWGLANFVTSAWNGTSALDSVIAAAGYRNSFSMCLTDVNPVMTVGVDYTVNTQFLWTRLTIGPYYQIYLSDIQAGSTSIGLSPTTLNSQMVILDSGTTLISIPEFILQPYFNILYGMCNNVNLVGICNAPSGQSIFEGYCYKMSASDMQKYPSMNIYVNGISSPFTLSPQYLFFSSPPYQCSVITVGDNSSPLILGDAFMRNNHIVFDRVVMQVGFAPLSTCPANSYNHPDNGSSIVSANFLASLFLVFLLSFLTF
jgi:hypothetical protein